MTGMTVSRGGGVGTTPYPLYQPLPRLKKKTDLVQDHRPP